MKMEIFEYTIYAKQEEVAGANDIEFAKDFAYNIANVKHCDVNVINAFTGEVVLSLVCIVRVTYNADMQEIERVYEVKEWEW